MEWIKKEEALKIREDLGKWMGEKWTKCTSKGSHFYSVNTSKNVFIDFVDTRNLHEHLTLNFLGKCLDKMDEDEIPYSLELLRDNAGTEVFMGDDEHPIGIPNSDMLESLAKAIHAAVKYIQEKD
jgi:hypothetical protein